MTVSDPSSPRLAALLSSASVEISSRGHQIAELRDHFAAGTDVTITFLPGDNYRHNVETATALRRAGYNPVPHIAAREMASREALDDFLARARGEADVHAHCPDRGRRRRRKGAIQVDTRCLRQRIDRGARDHVRQRGRSSRGPSVPRTAGRAERAQSAGATGDGGQERASTSSRNSASRARRSCNGSAHSIAPASIFPSSSVLPGLPRRRH